MTNVWLVDEKPDAAAVEQTAHDWVNTIVRACTADKPTRVLEIRNLLDGDRVEHIRTVSPDADLLPPDNCPLDIPTPKPFQIPSDLQPFLSSPRLARAALAAITPPLTSSSGVCAGSVIPSPNFAAPRLSPAIPTPPAHLDPAIYFIFRRVVPNCNETPYYPSEANPVIHCKDWHAIVIGTAVGVIGDW